MASLPFLPPRLSRILLGAAVLSVAFGLTAALLTTQPRLSLRGDLQSQSGAPSSALEQATRDFAALISRYVQGEVTREQAIAELANIIIRLNTHPASCDSEPRQCPDGSTVSPDPENSCAYPDCPAEETEEAAHACENRRDDNGDGIADGPGTTLQNSVQPAGYPFTMPDHSITRVGGELLGTIGTHSMFATRNVSGKIRPSLVVVDNTTGDIIQTVPGVVPTLNDARLTLAGNEVESADIIRDLEGGQLPAAATCDTMDAHVVHGVGIGAASATTLDNVVHLKVNTNDCVILAISTATPPVGGGSRPYRIVLQTIGTSAVAAVITDDASIENLPEAGTKVIRYTGSHPVPGGRAMYLGYYMTEAVNRFGVARGTTQTTVVGTLAGQPFHIPRRGFVIGTQDPELLDPRWSQNDHQYWFVGDRIVSGDRLFVAYNGVQWPQELPTGNQPFRNFDGHLVRVDAQENSVAVHTLALPPATPFLSNLLFDPERNRLYGELRGQGQRPLLAVFDPDALTLLSTHYLFTDSRDSGIFGNADNGGGGSLFFSTLLRMGHARVYAVRRDGYRFGEPQTTSASILDPVTGTILVQRRIHNFPTVIRDAQVDPVSGDLFLLDVREDGTTHLLRLNADTLAIAADILLPQPYLPLSMFLDAGRDRLLLLGRNSLGVYSTEHSGLEQMLLRTALDERIVDDRNVVVASIRPFRYYDQRTGLMYAVIDGQPLTLNVLDGSEQTVSVRASDGWTANFPSDLTWKPLSADLWSVTRDNVRDVTRPSDGLTLTTELLCNP